MNLFTWVRHALTNTLFGFPPAQPASAEFGYRGPYLARDMAAKSDPWGRAYFILGYNRNGEACGGPIWVVCLGSGGTINPANLQRDAAGRYPQTWNYAGLSSTNIAIRVN